MLNREHIVFWIILIAAAARGVQISMCTCLNDDYTFLLALNDFDYFFRPYNGVHYLPVQGFLWHFLLQFGENNIHVLLRLVHLLFQLGLAATVFSVIRRVFKSGELALVACAFTALHPITSEVYFYNINMQWTMAAMVQVFVFSIIAGLLKHETALGWACLSAGLGFALITNIASAFLVPAIMLVYTIHLVRSKKVDVKKWLIKMVLIGMPGFLYAAALTAMYFVIDANLSRVTPSSPGMLLVDHLWLLYLAFVWHVPFALSSYEWLCGFRAFSVPLFSWMVGGGIISLALIVFWKNRNPYYLYAGIFLLMALIVPPKAYVQPRYCFFLLPWSGVMCGYFVKEICQKLKIQSNHRRIIVYIIVGSILVQGVRSSAIEAKKVTICSSHVESLIKLSQNYREVDLCLENYPYSVGANDAWPRVTFHGAGQLYNCMLFAGYKGNMPKVTWSALPYPVQKVSATPEIYPSNSTNCKVRCHWNY